MLSDQAHPLGVHRCSLSKMKLTVIRKDCASIIRKQSNIYTELDAYPLPRIDDMINELSKYGAFSTFDLRSAYHQIRIVESDRKYTAFEANGELYEWTLFLKDIQILGYVVGNGVVKPDPERMRALTAFPPPTGYKALRRVLGMFAYYAKWIDHFADKVRPLAEAKNSHYQVMSWIPLNC